MRQAHFFSLLMLLLACGALGCEKREVLGRVYGTVSFQGEPLHEGVVIFRNDKLGVHMAAVIKEGGSYEVDMAKGYGLPLGEYTVSVNPPMIDAPLGPPGDRPKLDFSKIPERYRKPETSGLTLTVSRGQNELNIAMVSEPAP